MSRAERRQRADARREEVKQEMIRIIGKELPNTEGTPEDELQEAFHRGLAAADAWAVQQIRKHPQEATMIRDAARLAVRFLRNVRPKSVEING